MRFYRVQISYDRFISISSEEDLQKALYAFMEDKKIILSNGAVDGKMIMSITEDWNKAMGWNPNHKLDTNDWAEIKKSGTEKLYNGHLAQIKDYVNRLVSERKENLIGKELANNLLN